MKYANNITFIHLYLCMVAVHASAYVRVCGVCVHASVRARVRARALSICTNVLFVHRRSQPR